MNENLYAQKGVSKWVFYFEDGYIENLDYISQQIIINTCDEKEKIFITSELLSDELIRRCKNGIALTKISQTSRHKTIDGEDVYVTTNRDSMRILKIMRINSINNVGELRLILESV